MRRLPLSVVVWSLITIGCGGNDSPTSPSTLSSGLLRSPGSSQTAGSNGELGTPGVAVTPSSCAVVTNGAEFMASGTVRSDGTLLATHVIRVPAGASSDPAAPTPAPAEPPPGAVPGTQISIAARGMAANVGGECPDLTFTLGESRISTNSATMFFSR